jgi:SPP1 gp7 family putative phage head morphogenesis protein
MLDMPWQVSPDPLEPTTAIEWFRQKVVVSSEVFKSLNEKARRRAFSIAGVMQADLLGEVFTSLEQALQKGTPYEEWAAQIGPKLQQAWGGPRGFRTELVFRQNVLSSYAAGRFAQASDPEVLRARPYWMFDAVLDSNTTVICRSLNGVVLRHDHPFWRKNYPPRHFGCRSGVRSLTAREAVIRGITEPAPIAESPTGFGGLPDMDEWGNDMAVGAASSARSGTWVPAGKWKSFGDYNRPATVPAESMPVALLPTISDIGQAAFEAALVAAWGSKFLELQDPTGAGVQVSADYLLKHIKDDKRERLLSLIPDVIERPFEIWLQPKQSSISGRVVLRKTYLKLFEQPNKRRPILIVVEQHRGAVWEVYTVILSNVNQLQKNRAGYLLWGR